MRQVGARFGPVSFIEDISFLEIASNFPNYTEEYLRQAIGPIYASGSVLSESATAFRLDITGGSYYYGTKGYGAGDFDQNFGQQVVPVQYDDNSGTLQTPTAGYYVKHSFYIVGGGTQPESYGLVVGQEEFATLTEAEQGNLPLTPAVFKDSFTLTPVA